MHSFPCFQSYGDSWTNKILFHQSWLTVLWSNWGGPLHCTRVYEYLKSDLNEVLFVLELWELLCINNKIRNICNFKKNSTHKKYINYNYFLLSKFGFIWMKVDKTLFLPGFYDVVHYRLLRKWRQNNLCIHELSALWFEYNEKTEK